MGRDGGGSWVGGWRLLLESVLGAVVNLEVKSCEGWEVLDGLADAALCGDRDLAF